MNAETIRTWFRVAAARLHEQRDELTRLDSAIGDADHGVNMDRGFAAVLGKLDGQADLPPGRLLTTAGATLISTVGGASGPLWGTFLRRAGRALGEVTEFDGAQLAGALEAGLAGIVELGGAQEGDKTMVDALAPATRTLRGRLETDASLIEALAAARSAAEEGMRATVPMLAKKGRASYLGERSIGHQDPGATSSATIVGALEQAVVDQGVTERVLRGLAAATGVAVGRAIVLRETAPPLTGAGGPAEQARALEALARVAVALGRSAERLRAEGRIAEAEILEANQLMAEDPSLGDDLRVRAANQPAVLAVLEATEYQASLLAALPDPLLAARSADVRRIGQRAASLLIGGADLLASRRPSILIARDLGPADVAEAQLGGSKLRGIALAAGAATSHAAIMARALGLPMVVGLGEELLEAAEQELIVLDGDRGFVALGPDPDTLARARAAIRRASRAQRRLIAERALPAETRDGQRVVLLCNASIAAEVVAGLAAGAEGVGLLRTELAFLQARAWPTEREHAAALAPLLAPLAGRVATVRTLDFGADKTPPFLTGVAERGLTLALTYPESLAAQLRAILRTGAATRLRIMLPLVERAEQLETVRELLEHCLEDLGWAGPAPLLGAMIETPTAVERAPEIAAAASFLSIGTNDLVQYALRLDRERPLATARAAADPRVLKLVARVVEAARARQISVEVCGEAAGEPPLSVLLVGLGVSELSVTPARLDAVRTTVRGISAAEAAEVAGQALRATSAEEALALADALLKRGRRRSPAGDRGPGPTP